MKNISLGIIANTGKSKISELLPRFCEWLDSEAIPFILASEISGVLRKNNWKYLAADEIAAEVDFILSFGGDGTFLQSAHSIKPSEVPIIGVNLGAFGYLAEVSYDNLKDRIIDLIKGDYILQDRFMIQGRIENDASNTEIVGLNDIVLEKGAFPRTIKLDTYIDGIYLNTFNADGLIVSTPTGSTGYSLSAGGPIIDPDVNIMIISPICPHMLANRPVVVDGHRKIEITAYSTAGRLQVIADGQSVMHAVSGDKISIERTDYVTKVVHFDDYSFYNLLRTKLHWKHKLISQPDDISPIET